MTTHNVATKPELYEASQVAVPGDTIHIIGAGTPYEGYLMPENSGTAGNRITVTAEPDVVLAPDRSWLMDKDFWTVTGLTFSQYPATCIRLGTMADARDIIIEDCSWMHSTKQAIRIEDARALTIRGCQFRDIRSRQADKDRVAIVVRGPTRDMLVENCQFEDIGSDGIHILPGGVATEYVGNIIIRNCQFWVNRPYGSVEWQDFSTNVGENGIDIKAAEGLVLVQDCAFRGFQPKAAGQDCSGSAHAECIRVSHEARKVRLVNCDFRASGTGILGSDYPVIAIKDCAWTDVGHPIHGYNMTLSVIEGMTVTGSSTPGPEPDIVGRVAIYYGQ